VGEVLRVAGGRGLALGRLPVADGRFGQPAPPQVGVDGLLLGQLAESRRRLAVVPGGALLRPLDAAEAADQLIDLDAGEALEVPLRDRALVDGLVRREGDVAWIMGPDRIARLPRPAQEFGPEIFPD
jgi:hypothetical protein